MQIKALPDIRNTGPVAEALAYYLCSFGRALRCRGAFQRRCPLCRYVSESDGFVALIPMGVVVNEQTGTDWEARGLPLDLRCDADEAEG